MKRLIYIIIAGVVMLNSCTEYLGIKPRGYDVAYKIEHYEGLIYGREMFMLDEVFPFMCFELTTDEGGFANSYSLIGSDATNAYTWSETIFRPDENCGEWNDPVAYIYPLNIVINQVSEAEGGTEEEREALRAEARVLRAYMTYTMAQFFGRHYNPSTAAADLCVPIITTASTIGNEFPRKTVQDVYDFIIKEMTESVPLLPVRREHCNRAFSVTGNAMLGKVYWTMGKYPEALEYLKTAYEGLEAAGAGLMDYAGMVSDGEITYPVDDLQNPELLWNYETMTHIWSAMYPSYYGSSLFTIKPEVMTRYFSSGDYRLCFYSGMKSGKTLFNKFDGRDTYHLNLSNFVGNIGIRVGDLYLMYAECLARTDEYAEARRIIEEFRSFRIEDGKEDVEAADGDELIRFIVAERMREYLGYGNSWFDMRRLWNDPLFQDMKEMYVHSDGRQDYTLDEERLVMRIPPQVMEWHPEYVDNE